MEHVNYHIDRLKKHLTLKQRENPQYSLRAFSRDLNINSSTLSQIINNKRSIPKNKLDDVIFKLGLTPKEKTLFKESFYRKKGSIDNISITELDRRFMLDESYYHVIAEWEHFALLELFNLKGFHVSSKSIASKLKISLTRVEVVLNNLISCGLILEEDEKFKRAHPDIKTTEDISSNALKASHKETLNIGLKKLEEVDISNRDFSSSTIAINSKKLDEAKTIIREFRLKMKALFEKDEKDEVYQLAVQFYPLSQIIQKTKMEVNE